MTRRLAFLFSESADLPDHRFVLQAASVKFQAIDELVNAWIHLPRRAPDAPPTLLE